MKNSYEIRGEVTAIIINSPKHGSMETIISTDKLELVKSFKNTWYPFWCEGTQSFYVYGNMPQVNKVRRQTVLHRWVNGEPEGMAIDHINHDTLNNTDGNLRVITISQNLQNRKLSGRSTTGFRGVSWNKRSRKYKCTVIYQGKQYHGGFFDDIKEAAEVVKRMRKQITPFSIEDVV